MNKNTWVHVNTPIVLWRKTHGLCRKTWRRSERSKDGRRIRSHRACHFCLTKTKQINDKHTVYMGTLYLYWSLYWIQSTCTCSHRSLPILPSATMLKEIWLKRLRVVCWFPALLQSIRLITTAGRAYRKPPIKLRWWSLSFWIILRERGWRSPAETRSRYESPRA